MKTIIYSSFLAIAILLSSCSSLGLTKRKYRKGYHWSIAKSSSTPEKTNSLVANPQQKKEPILSSQKTDLSTESLIPVSFSKISTTQTERELKPTSFNHKTGKLNSETNPLIASQKLIKSKKTLKSIPVRPKSSPSSKSKTNDIILILCCLFIPPLAVFLLQDDITVDFWIDLVLCLLLWIPGVVFAFLVCFADVSLQ